MHPDEVYVIRSASDAVSAVIHYALMHVNNRDLCLAASLSHRLNHPVGFSPQTASAGKKNVLFATFWQAAHSPPRSTASHRPPHVQQCSCCWTALSSCTGEDLWGTATVETTSASVWRKWGRWVWTNKPPPPPPQWTNTWVGTSSSSSQLTWRQCNTGINPS